MYYAKIFNTVMQSGWVYAGWVISEIGITVYCDADWKGDTIDRKSRTGYLIYVRGTLISWSSRKQNTLARSSTEAEYRAIDVGGARCGGTKANANSAG